MVLEKTNKAIRIEWKITSGSWISICVYSTSDLLAIVRIVVISYQSTTINPPNCIAFAARAEP